MKTKDTISKLSALHGGQKFIAFLEAENNKWNRGVENNNTLAAREAQMAIAGYLNALADAEMVTETERKLLFLYYATIKGTAN